MMTLTNTFTTTEWVIYWIHVHTTNRRTDTSPTRFTGFT